MNKTYSVNGRNIEWKCNEGWMEMEVYVDGVLVTSYRLSEFGGLRDCEYSDVEQAMRIWTMEGGPYGPGKTYNGYSWV